MADIRPAAKAETCDWLKLEGAGLVGQLQQNITGNYCCVCDLIK